MVANARAGSTLNADLLILAYAFPYAKIGICVLQLGRRLWLLLPPVMYVGPIYKVVRKWQG